MAARNKAKSAVRKQDAPRKAWHSKLKLRPHRIPPDSVLYRLPELAVETGIADGALEHDHYIYGTPKKYTKESS